MIPTLADNVAEMAVGVGGAIGLVAVIASGVRSISVGRARERTRQEIAAYVAEGSMSADEGERLLKAGSQKDSCG